MTALFISSFLAGVLTILAPCVLPVLPVVLAGSVTERQRWYPYVVTLSLAASIVLFTVILKATTALIDIPPSFWKNLSGGILLALGLVYIFPHAWAWIAGRFGFDQSNISLDKAQDIGSPVLRAIATGGALGPVFSTCSPTYSLLLATVFPVSFIAGIGYTAVYALGLALMLTIIAIGGRSIIAKFRGIADEKGWFKRILGIVFILIGLAIITGIDKKIESRALDIWNPSSLEEGLLDRLIPKSEGSAPIAVSAVIPMIQAVPLTSSDNPLPTEEKTLEVSTPDEDKMTEQKISSVSPSIESTPAKSMASSILQDRKIEKIIPPLSIAVPYTAPEFRGLTNWINSDPLTLANLRGQVVIIDFWTFGCSNCQAVLPHVQALYEKYKNQGLVIVGVHAPEFAYEQKYENVLAAVKKTGLSYPVVLDNDFSTWNAYSNQYWPAMYIIDKSGKVRHTHFGEGQYAQTDEIVGSLLSE